MTKRREGDGFIFVVFGLGTLRVGLGLDEGGLFIKKGGGKEKKKSEGGGGGRADICYIGGRNKKTK